MAERHCDSFQIPVRMCLDVMLGVDLDDQSQTSAQTYMMPQMIGCNQLTASYECTSTEKKLQPTSLWW